MGRRAISFTAIALVAVGFGLVLIDPPKVIFAVFLAYLASGYLVWLWQAVRKPHASAVNVVADSSDKPVP